MKKCWRREEQEKDNSAVLPARRRIAITGDPSAPAAERHSCHLPLRVAHSHRFLFLPALLLDS